MKEQNSWQKKFVLFVYRSVRFAAGDQDLRPSGVTQPRSKDGSQDNASNTWTYSFSFISKYADDVIDCHSDIF